MIDKRNSVRSILLSDSSKTYTETNREKSALTITWHSPQDSEPKGLPQFRRHVNKPPPPNPDPIETITPRQAFRPPPPHYETILIKIYKHRLGLYPKLLQGSQKLMKKAPPPRRRVLVRLIIILFMRQSAAGPDLRLGRLAMRKKWRANCNGRSKLSVYLGAEDYELGLAEGFRGEIRFLQGSIRRRSSTISTLKARQMTTC